MSHTSEMNCQSARICADEAFWMPAFSHSRSSFTLNGDDIHDQRASNVEKVFRIKRRLLAQPFVKVQEERRLALQLVGYDGLVQHVRVGVRGLQVALETVAIEALQRGDVLLHGIGKRAVGPREVEPVAQAQLARRQARSDRSGKSRYSRGVRGPCGWMFAGAIPKPQVLPVGAVRISVRMGMSTLFAGCGLVSSVKKF